MESILENGCERQDRWWIEPGSSLGRTHLALVLASPPPADVQKWASQKCTPVNGVYSKNRVTGAPQAPPKKRARAAGAAKTTIAPQALSKKRSK